MAASSNIQIRNVLPTWRDFKSTMRDGEVELLDGKVRNALLFPISPYIESYVRNPSGANAGELISAAIMNAQTSSHQVKSAAQFILTHKDEVSDIQIRLANTIVGTRRINEKLSKATDKIELLLNQHNYLSEKIRLLRANIRFYQYNPVAYVELALLYVRLGYVKKAEELLEIALRLAPDSRYVCRAAARFYLHIGDHSHAHYILEHTPSLLYDPWLLASEIAIQTERKKSSKHIKSGIKMLYSDDFPANSLCELGSAIGTEEAMSGNKKKMLRALSVSLKNPNDNSLSQVEWLTDKYGGVDICRDLKKTRTMYEADTMYAYAQEDYQMCMDSALDWLYETPYSVRTIGFSSFVSYSFLKDYDTAEKILSIGLLSNPHDVGMLNDKAYCLALNDKTDNAEAVLKRLRKEIGQMPSGTDNRIKVCFDATSGLNEYRKGNVEGGRYLYQQAIEQAVKLNDSTLTSRAMLNYMREEARVSQCLDPLLLEHMELLDCGDRRETDQLKKDILLYIKK